MSKNLIMQPAVDPSEISMESKIQNLQDLIVQLRNSKQWEKILIIGEFLQNINPEDPHLYFNIGYAYLQMHDLDKAESFFQHAMEKGDDSINTLLLMSKIAEYRGDLEGMRFWSEKTIEREPDTIDARFTLAKVSLGIGETDKAELLYKEIIERDPNNVQARCDLAEIYQTSRKLIEAKEQIVQAIEIEPDNELLYTFLGNIYDRLFKYEEALDTYFKALELNPQKSSTYYNIGDAFLSLKNPEKGVLFLQKASEIDPYNSLTHYDLGKAFIDLKKYPQASIESQAALRYDPDMAFGKTNIGLAAMQNLGVANLNLGLFKEAETCFRKNLKHIAPNFFNLGLTLYRQKKYEESLKNFLWAVELIPDDPEYWDLVGNAYMAMDQLPEAIEALENAIEVDNTYALAHYDLGVVLAKIQGQEDNALRSFQRSIEFIPNDPHPYYGITCIQALRNNKDLAFQYLENVLEKGFTDWSDLDANTDLDNIRKDRRYQELKMRYPSHL